MALHDVTLAEPRIDDGAAMWRVARAVGLDPNSPYKYLVFCRDFAATSAVARSGEGVVGFVTGYRRPASPGTLFIWQVGVLPASRGQGVAGAMLDYLVSGPQQGALPTHLEASVTPDNEASFRLFTAFAERHHAPVRRTLLFGESLFPEPHPDEVLMEIGPFRVRSFPEHAGDSSSDFT